MTLHSIDEKTQHVLDIDRRRGWIVECIGRAECAGYSSRVSRLLRQLTAVAREEAAEFRRISGDVLPALRRRLIASRSPLSTRTPKVQSSAPLASGKPT